MQARSRAAGQDDPFERHAYRGALLRGSIAPAHCGSLSCGSQAQALPVVPPGLNLRAPLAVLDVPADRVAQPRLECMARTPAELTPNLRRVDRIAPVMAGAIRHERPECPMTRSSGCELIEDIADEIDDVEIRPLVPSADVVLLAYTSGPERQQD